MRRRPISVLLAMAMLVLTACSAEPPVAEESEGLRVVRFTAEGDGEPEGDPVVGVFSIDRQTGCLLFGEDEFGTDRLLAIPRSVSITIEGTGIIVGAFGGVAVGDPLLLDATTPAEGGVPPECGNETTPVLWSSPSSWDDPLDR